MLEERKLVINDDGTVTGICLTLGRPSVDNTVMLGGSASLNEATNFLNQKFDTFIGEVYDKDHSDFFREGIERFRTIKFDNPIGILKNYFVSKVNDSWDIFVTIHPTPQFLELVKSGNYIFLSRTISKGLVDVPNKLYLKEFIAIDACNMDNLPKSFKIDLDGEL